VWLLSKIEERNIEKIKIYLVKKTKMKIQNKYVFRTIISKFLYFFKKICMDLAWLPSLCTGLAWLPNSSTGQIIVFNKLMIELEKFKNIHE